MDPVALQQLPIVGYGFAPSRSIYWSSVQRSIRACTGRRLPTDLLAFGGSPLTRAEGRYSEVRYFARILNQMYDRLG